MNHTPAPQRVCVLNVLLTAALCLCLAGCAVRDPLLAAPSTAPASSLAPVDEVACVRAPALDAGEELYSEPEAVAGPLEIRLGQAVIMAVQNNRALRVECLNPPTSRTFEDQERALFDPILSAELLASRIRARRESATGAVGSSRSQEVGASVGVRQFLPTGTSLAAELSTVHEDLLSGRDEFASRLGLSVTQPVLRGFGADVNLVRLRQARLDTQNSEYDLRGFAEALVADVENTYWEYALAGQRVKIFEESFTLAQQQLDDIRTRIRVGELAETELAAAQAELALRNEGLINARSQVSSVRLRLLRLIAPVALAAGQRDVRALTEPAAPDFPMEETAAYIQRALLMRPEMNQARLAVRRDDLELIRTRNGLLPRMDLFATLGRTGYADSFGGSARNMADGSSYDVVGGLFFEFPPYNREAEAVHLRARISRRQSDEALLNLADLVRVDVENALIEVERTQEQVRATAATRQFQEEKLRAETAKFRVGKSTALLVAATQRDLVASRVSQVEAVVGHLQALVSLFRLEGTLLERRGIAAPGAAPEA